MANLTDRVLGARTELAYKAPCRCATTANITLSGMQTIDGVALAATDTNLRVLVKNQTDATQNGVYLAQLGPWARAVDFDSASSNAQTGDIISGARVFVTSGTVNANVVFVLSSADPITLGTSNITFVTEASLLGSAIECVLDNGDSILTVNMAEIIEAPFSGTVILGTLIGNASGSLTIDVRKCSYAQYDAGATHPVAADSITASAPLALSSASKYQDATLTGWTTAISKGDLIQFIVTASNATIKRAVASLRLSRTGP